MGPMLGHQRFPICILIWDAYLPGWIFICCKDSSPGEHSCSNSCSNSCVIRIWWISMTHLAKAQADLWCAITYLQSLPSLWSFVWSSWAHLLHVLPYFLSIIAWYVALLHRELHMTERRDIKSIYVWGGEKEYHQLLVGMRYLPRHPSQQSLCSSPPLSLQTYLVFDAMMWARANERERFSLKFKDALLEGTYIIMRWNRPFRARARETISTIYHGRP